MLYRKSIERFAIVILKGFRICKPRIQYKIPYNRGFLVGSRIRIYLIPLFVNFFFRFVSKWPFIFARVFSASNFTESFDTFTYSQSQVEIAFSLYWARYQSHSAILVSVAHTSSIITSIDDSVPTSHSSSSSSTSVLSYE